ncbi:Uncharacterised protein [uncultured archaeon]|nr:Uncharacterised protein [uncultured archaeon]
MFGLLGLVLILVAWAPGVAETIRQKKPGLKLEFIIIYFLGSLCLVVYGIQLNALPFVILNALAAMVPLVHLYYLLAGRGLQGSGK